MDLPNHKPRDQRKRITTIIFNSQNLSELSDNLYQSSRLLDTVMQPFQGPRMMPSQIQSKSGDTGDLFESGNLFNETSNLGAPQVAAQLPTFLTASGTLVAPYCQHTYLTQEIEQKIFAQIKTSNVCQFTNICQYNCRMKTNSQLTNVQKLLLYQLHENQANMLKQVIGKKQKQHKVIECQGQGCDYYFILNEKLKQNYFYCPLCLEAFPIKL